MLTTAFLQWAKMQPRLLETLGDAIGAAYTTPFNNQRKRRTDFKDTTH